MGIKNIGAEMAAQNNRSTQFPLFVIQVDVKRWLGPYGEYMDHDGKELQEGEACDEHEDLDEPPQDCEKCTWNYYQIDQEFELRAGIFFTDKACQKHIDENHYHYFNPRVYGVGAWRNPEMVVVMQHLIKLSGKEVPGHYK